MLIKHNKELTLKLPKAIIFDTDNTLYEYSIANNAAEAAVCKKANNLIGINKEKFKEVYKKARLDIKKNLGSTASSHSRLLYFQRMIEILGLKAQLLLALDLEQTFWRTFLANAPLFPGVKDLLIYLKNNNIPIGVVTDLTSHIQMRKLTYFGLEDIFDAVVTSEEVGADKPDPRGFNLILEKLNLSNMKNVWMIGDDPVSDIDGSQKLGGIAFQKINKNSELKSQNIIPDISFTNFKEIENLVLKIKE